MTSRDRTVWLIVALPYVVAVVILLIALFGDPAS